jgi:NAD(P) transhydrogenase subunit alpha
VSLVVGVLADSHPGERRVALTPAVIPKLAKRALDVVVQRGAGERSGYSDDAYETQGARITETRREVVDAARILALVRPPSPDSTDREGAPFRAEQVVLGLLDPLGAPAAIRDLAEHRVTAFAFELLPRISRAQPMDALSSQATIAGYKAVLLAASALDKIFPLMMTAAGTITPARVLVVGAGVAGLQAIATAHRLGAAVHAYDVRPAVKEQVESLGAKFLQLDLSTDAAETKGGYAQEMGEEFYRRQRELMTEAVRESDVVVTTAVVPGRRAPVLLTEAMLGVMRPGAVIVDLAAESGGNCELTRPRETVDVGGVTLIGAVDLASTMPRDASQMYAHNVAAFLQNLVRDGEVRLNREDPIIAESLVTHGGEIVNPRVREAWEGRG